MTLVKLKKNPAAVNFNSFMDDFFPSFSSMYQDDLDARNFKYMFPVNVKEIENGYQLEVVAPGFSKEDFQLGLENNTLTISAEKKTEEDGEKAERYVRHEYSYQSFKRSFTIEKNVDAEKISAEYVNGILTLTLPKKPELKTAPKQITIQ